MPLPQGPTLSSRYCWDGLWCGQLSCFLGFSWEGEKLKEKNWWKKSGTSSDRCNPGYNQEHTVLNLFRCPLLRGQTPRLQICPPYTFSQNVGPQRWWYLGMSMELRNYIIYGCFQTLGTPKSSILIGFSITNHPFWGTHIVGNTHMLIYIFGKWVKQLPLSGWIRPVK